MSEEFDAAEAYSVAIAPHLGEAEQALRNLSTETSTSVQTQLDTHFRLLLFHPFSLLFLYFHLPLLFYPIP